METDSVVIFKSPNPKSASNLSPGNNPFDDLWKKTMDIVSLSEQVNRRSSFQLATDFASLGRKSLSFRDLNTSDFGRESMGILPPDFGRDSLDFMNVSSLDTDRESLGIIQINALRDSLSFRRESLSILNLQDFGRESLECGKESLGILHLKSPDVRFGDEEKRIPDIMLTTIEENTSESCNIFNTAFLQPHSRKSSVLSSSSSINPSFNSLSLEGPSRIYSVSSLRSYNEMLPHTSSNMGNLNSISYSTSSVISSIHSPLNKGKIFSPSELNIRSRIQSVPVDSSEFSPLREKLDLEDVNERKFWSTGRTTYVKTLERSFHGVIDFNTADISNEFQDSVFIEGHILAEKIADGSILNESSGGEVGVLDCTPQPDWPNDGSYIDPKENECQKCDTETVFKSVDKMLPLSTQEILNNKLKTSKNESNSSNENEEKINTSEGNDSKKGDTGEQNVSKLLQNISDIQQEPKKNFTDRKDPKQILNNLSELLSCTNASDKQKSDGQSLLNSLADMLCESKSNIKNNQDDSGHSSINELSDSPNKESHQCFQVLDLRLKATEGCTSNENSYDKIGVMDLSLKSKPVENLMEKRLSRSLCSSNVKFASLTEKKNTSSSSLDMNKNKTTNSSIDSNDSKNSSNLLKSHISGKLRHKQFNALKKGPMKAIIPVGDMRKKGNTPVTPERDEKNISAMRSKRTSTPINEPKLKPMAASTPTARSTKETARSSKETKSNGDSTSKLKTLNASKSFTRDRAYSSTSLPRPSMGNVDFKLRRNSVSDVKKQNPVRRNSVERESGITSSAAKARQNLDVPYCQPQKQKSLLENKPLIENKSKLGESRPIAKSSNSESKSKAAMKVGPKRQNQTETTTASSSKATVPRSREATAVISKPSPSQTKNNIKLHYERRSSSREVVKNKETNVKANKRHSIGNDSGMMSSMAKIRQNILDSPYFNASKEDALNKNYIVLSENKGLQKTVTQLRKSGKTGKENIEK